MRTIELLTRACGAVALALTLGALRLWTAMDAGAAPAPAAPQDNGAIILTPPAPAAPRINGPGIFGVRPGHPVLYRIPATGTRPMTFSADGLPRGVKLDPASGRLTGAIDKPGTYTLTLHAQNGAGSAQRPFRLVVGDRIALTPPMGWNSYNCWGTVIDQQKIMRSARAMVASGLIDHGWSYINMDDGWQGRRAGESKAMQADPRGFPDMKRLCDDIHALGLKVGIYSSPWVVTYGGRLGGSAENPDGAAQRWPPGAPKNKKVLPFAIGKYHFTAADARQFEAWGIDYLKYDWGPVEFPETREMNDELLKLNRDIVFSLSNNHVKNLFRDIANVSTAANAWRTTTDISDNWGRVCEIGFGQGPWAPFAGPGHFNDADMLVVGWIGGWNNQQHATKLTPDEQYTHISLWSLLASPLLIGCDLERLDPFTLSLLTNDEVLAVNQDALCRQALSVSRQGELEVFAKQLEDGTLAVGVFNHGLAEGRCAARWSDLKINGPAAIRDLWRQKDLGTFEGKYEATVRPHGVVLLRVAPIK